MEPLALHFFAGLSARITAMKAAGRDIIRLDEGSPDLPPAPHIIEALSRSAALPDRHAYQTHRGPAALREAWAAYYQDTYGVSLDPEREILPLLGSKEGIFHLALAYIEPGELALAPDPGYITYTRGAIAAGGGGYVTPLLAERDYLPDLQAIPNSVLSRAKLLWLNYPNNPTAATATLDFLAKAVAFAREHDLLLCHDAAYSRVTFDGRPSPSVLQVAGAREVAVEFNTLSKSHNMAGWRVATMVGNPEAVRALYTLKTNADSSHFLPIMEATIEAITGDQSWLEERNRVYRQRRDAMIQALHEAGLKARIPQASLYIWCPVPAGWDSQGFALAALEATGVSLTPGTVFGRAGEGYVRIALTAPLERIQEAGQRVKEWMNT
ncbi:MAG: aminotransferase class I/II-fold pyridoxal phosphate-dependent enzyme [Chloroflexota bacterium]